MFACVRVVGSQHPWPFLQGVCLLDKLLCHLLNHVSVVLFQVVFSNRKTLSLGIVYFLCVLCSLKDCLFQCVVSNVYRGDHMLIFRVLLEREILYIIVYGLGVFQVGLDRLSLEKLEKSFLFGPLFVVRFNFLSSFLQS